MPSIDFDRFNELVDLAQTFQALGIDKGRANPLYLRFACPLCNHHSQRSFHAKWDTSKWYCHSCCRGGGPIQLADLFLGLPGPMAAVEHLCKVLGLDVPYRPRVRTRRHRDRSGEIVGDTDDDDDVD